MSLTTYAILGSVKSSSTMRGSFMMSTSKLCQSPVSFVAVAVRTTNGVCSNRTYLMKPREPHSKGYKVVAL